LNGVGGEVEDLEESLLIQPESLHTAGNMRIRSDIVVSNKLSR